MPQFSGIIPPVVTPLTRPDQLDGDAVRRIVEHLLTGGVNGLFVLGTTGEGPSLTYQIRYEMVEIACEAAAGRVPPIRLWQSHCFLRNTPPQAEQRRSWRPLRTTMPPVRTRLRTGFDNWQTLHRFH